MDPAPKIKDSTSTTKPDLATPADLALAAALPRVTREGSTSELSAGIAELLRDEDLVASMNAHAADIDAEGAGTVADVLSRVPGYFARYEAHARLVAAVASLRASIERDKVDFARFVSVAVKVCETGSELSPRSRRSIEQFRK